jgi:hypothetical protein
MRKVRLREATFGRPGAESALRAFLVPRLAC